MQSLELTTSKPWKRIRLANTSYEPACLRNLGNQLFQCHKSGITVYDIKLNKVKEIRLDEMGAVYDVCGFSSGYLVVAAQRGLYQIKENGQYQ